LSAAVAPSYAFMTPSFLSSSPTQHTAVPLKPFSALSMVATGDLGLTVHGDAKPRKTREVCNVLLWLCLSCVDAELFWCVCRNSRPSNLNIQGVF
jgi:hypothetical protein